MGKRSFRKIPATIERRITDCHGVPSSYLHSWRWARGIAFRIFRVL